MKKIHPLLLLQWRDLCKEEAEVPVKVGSRPITEVMVVKGLLAGLEVGVNSSRPAVLQAQKGWKVINIDDSIENISSILWN